ncbi:MAG: hypothetical protein J6Z36_02565, partial [Clostridia bacterium]|nr:hypothetical protein [Clostridia bacterium]
LRGEAIADRQSVCFTALNRRNAKKQTKPSGGRFTGARRQRRESRRLDQKNAGNSFRVACVFVFMPRCLIYFFIVLTVFLCSVKKNTKKLTFFWFKR